MASETSLAANMKNERPNPDEVLARIQAEDEAARRGRLKIFFGYAAGVGKTYAMLEAAHREKADGIDVVIGYVEPHGRPETESLQEGLEALSARTVPYRGVNLREFDVDAALARRPRLLLVDELAHSNVEGSRHAKRWQDVDELLAAGIDVYTTLNVQHVESLNDVIAQITGVVVRETLPDSILERADAIELIDLTPEDLIERLSAGKVYLPTQAERALQQFFQKANLQALRELSLRQAAHRLRRDVDAARQAKAARAPWATSERLLVCVGPSPTTAKLIRATKRMAEAYGADWVAVAVATRDDARQAPATRQQVVRHLQLAEQLGGETHTLVGQDVASAILDYARSRNVTKIIVGKTAQPWWKRAFLGAVVDRLLEKSGDIDVYVIRGEGEAPAQQVAAARPRPVAWRGYCATLLVVAICGLLGWLNNVLFRSEANAVMLFLLGVAFVAARLGRGHAITASIASVLVFDFFFVPPFGTFDVSDGAYLVTFAVMLIIGILISQLTARVRDQLGVSQRIERRTAALFRLTRQMSEVAGLDFVIGTACQQVTEIFDGEVVLFVRTDGNELELRHGQETSVAALPINAVVARWVADHDEMAGHGTDTLPNATALFAPLTASRRTVGALGVRPVDPDRFFDPEQRQLLATCASLIALSIERDLSLLEAQRAEIQVQAEQLRNALLSSVSHDLRTPLAAIAGASSSLLDAGQLDADVRNELLQSILDESRRLARLVDNLLDMTRIESGIVLNKQWHVLEEVVGSALARLARELRQHELSLDLPANLPMVQVDGVLLEQLFCNLLENAARYTPAGSRIEIAARQESDCVQVQIRDNGPGLPRGAESRVFEKFFRGGEGSAADHRRGVGLGLAICKGIAAAHGGTISARNLAKGGAEFTLKLPTLEPPPRVALDGPPTAAAS